ncbi:Alpha/Beta hydrolase protein [Apiospora arundinis]|uniref:1-alkyl-2-acetylglycerophosphocholine esterase n=1 Tax=Apiospora arundinis TaxID=335852 RepID=A0ABR2I9T6_9PEZI
MQFLRFLPFLALTGALVLPRPSGPYPVSVVVESLTDKSRPDPYAPSDKPHQRRVVTSLFLPIDPAAVRSQVRTVPYMTPLVAADYGLLATTVGLPNDTFAEFKVESSHVLGGRCNSAARPPTSLPLVIFSPGFGQSRLLYGIMARSLASEGYAVVTIDHPYDASIVEFPDGSVVRGANISTDDDAALAQVIQVRSTDVSFVIDQLKDSRVFHRAYDNHKVAIDFKRIVMYGHSLGGATAASVMLSEPRILGGVDMDGRFFNPVLEKGVDRPLVLLGRTNHSAEDATWPVVYEKLRATRVEMAVEGTLHSSFTDFPVIVNSLNLTKSIAEVVGGSISGKRMDVVVKSVMIAFCDFVFGKNPAPEILQSGKAVLPELTVLRGDLRK